MRLSDRIRFLLPGRLNSKEEGRRIRQQLYKPIPQNKGGRKEKGGKRRERG